MTSRNHSTVTRVAAMKDPQFVSALNEACRKLEDSPITMTAKLLKRRPDHVMDRMIDQDALEQRKAAYVAYKKVLVQRDLDMDPAELAEKRRKFSAGRKEADRKDLAEYNKMLEQQCSAEPVGFWI